MRIAILTLAAASLQGCQSQPVDAQQASKNVAGQAVAESSAGDRDARPAGDAARTPQLTLVDEKTFAAAAGGAAQRVDFDQFEVGSFLRGQRFGPMEIQAGKAEPVIVLAADTRTPATDAIRDPHNYRLVAPQGARVLSPGGALLDIGPKPMVEDDDLSLRFDPPVAAVAFTLLTPSADGLSFTEVSVYDAAGKLLYKGQVGLVRLPAAPGANFPAPGSAFWGCVSSDPIIARIEIDEQDSDASCPDANVGYADIQFVPAPPAAISSSRPASAR